ncbi:hypothetical protein, partial [Proteus mirabilis]|uniref:hypothetical protein n=1 Tax=Proteus mirabilis TaxID=584 RepID=UPI001C12E387
EEPNTSHMKLDLFVDDDDRREKETQELNDDEELQDGDLKSPPFEIQIVIPPPIKEDHIYKDPIWLACPPLTLTMVI